MRVARWLAGAVAVLGMVVLVGWALDVEIIQAPLPGTRRMVPNTAALFLASSLSVWLLSLSGRRWARRVGRGCAAITVLAAATFLLEYLLGIERGIDRWLADVDPARPSVETSLTFLLFGLALLGLDRRPRRGPFPAEALAVLGGVGSLLVSIGYLYGYSYTLTPSSLSATIGMALHTSLGLMALAIAILAVRPDRGLIAIITSDLQGGVLTRRLLVVAALTIPATGALGLWLQHLGAFPPPGSAVLGTTASLVVILGALLVSGRALDRTDAERGRGEAALRQWKQFFDLAQFGAVFGASDGRLLQFNDAFARMHGYAPDELVGRSIADLLSPAARETLQAHFDRIERQGKHRFESEHLRKDGSVFPVVVDATAIRDDAGALQHRVVYVQDITDELRARADQARLASLVETSEDAIFATDPGGVVITWNRGAERLYGYTAAEMIGRSVDAMLPPERAGERTALLEQLARGQAICGFETERMRKDGSRVPVSLTASPIVTPRGVTGYSIIARDMTARRAAEQEIAQLYQTEAIERARLESILAQLPEAVILLDAEGVPVHENPAARSYRGRDGAPRRYDVRWPNGSPVADAELPLARAFARGEVVQGEELAICTQEGRLVPILASATPIRSGDALIGAVVVFRDIQALKHLERLREEWTSVVAHDLRQPLNGMLLAAELLASSELPADATRLAERIRSGTLRLATMISDLLDASKLEAHRMELRRTPADLRELVDDAVASMPALARRCDVQVEPFVPPVLVDPARMLQVLGNLLSNAIKYGDPAAPITIAIAHAGDAARITITNRGPGIAEDELPTLFDRFVRTRTARQRSVDGTGLGLYICKGLVEAHGGQIWVESRVGETTSFHLTLPYAPEALEEVERSPTATPPPAP